MHVSLTVDTKSGTCSKCGAGSHGSTHDHAHAQVALFSIVTDGHAGDAEALCAGCLFEQGGLSVDIPMQPLAPGPAPRKKTLKRAKKVSENQEHELAGELNAVLGGFQARRQPGSGNQRGAKGDVRAKGRLRLEAKFTTAASYRLELDDLEKIASEASHGELAVLVIDYMNPGTRKLTNRYAVIHFTDLKELLRAASKHR